jgi:hypothetical protein
MSTVDFVTIKKLSELTGITLTTIKKNITNKIWLEGVHYFIHDKTLYFSIETYNSWARLMIEKSSQKKLKSPPPLV